jgi:hypothetical protein
MALKVYHHWRDLADADRARPWPSAASTACTSATSG